MAVATASSFKLTLASVNKSVDSFPLSLKFMKKLVSISVSTVISRRLNNESSNFHHHHYGDVDYYIVKKAPKDPKFKALFNSIHGVIEAIENQYLKELHLIIVEGINSDRVLEKYTYRFIYNKEGLEVCETKKMRRQVTLAVTKHLSDIKELEQFPRLPEDSVFHIFLTYYDNTPNDYEPFFFGGNSDKTHLIIDELLCNERRISFEKVFTGYHSVSCSAKIKEFQLVTEEVDENENFDEEITAIIRKDKANQNETTISIPSNGGINDSLDITMNYSSNNFNCICGINEEIKNMQTVICSLCHSYYHYLCVSLLMDEFPEKFVCWDCSDCMPGVEATNAQLATLEKGQRETLVTRLMILNCILESKSYPEELINKLSESKRRDLDGFFKDNKFSVFQKKTNKKILDLVAIEKYFEDMINKKNDDEEQSLTLVSTEDIIPPKKMKKRY